jgi:hypothetical protein
MNAGAEGCPSLANLVGEVTSVLLLPGSGKVHRRCTGEHCGGSVDVLGEQLPTNKKFPGRQRIALGIDGLHNCEFVQR